MAIHHKCRWALGVITVVLFPAAFAGCGSSSEGDDLDATSPTSPRAPSTPAAAPGAAGDPDTSNPAPDTSASGGEGQPDPTLAGNEGAVTPAARDDGDGTTPPAPAEEPPTAAVPSGPCSAEATLEAGDTTRTITVGGLERSFLVHAPPSYDGTTRLPVVFDFHGLGTQNTLQKQISRWDDVGDAQGFITVYPQGVENAWNAGGCCDPAAEQQIDDVAFVRAIIAKLQTDACIDARRVFASGCSNGGAMSYRLACEAADVIAAVAPVDFDCVVGGQCSACAPARPITEVQFRGTNDQLVPYEGNGNFFLGAQANLATWGEINQCSGDQAALPGSDGCEAFPVCGEGAQTVLCTVQGGTHCGSYGSFMIAEKAWSILRNVVLP